jgi:hypothetical protein
MTQDQSRSPVGHSDEPTTAPKTYDLIAALARLEDLMPGKYGTFFFSLIYDRARPDAGEARGERLRLALETLRLTEDDLYDLVGILACELSEGRSDDDR